MVLLTIAHLLDIIMYQRLNRVFGIPDWLFMLGKASTGATVGMMVHLAASTLYVAYRHAMQRCRRYLSLARVITLCCLTNACRIFCQQLC